MFKTDFERIIFSAITALLIIPSTALCDRVQIFDVRKNLPMSSKDPVYKDYYISAGKDSGLKENMIISVARTTTVHDPLYNVSRGEILIKVGQLKILQVGEHVSVARAYSSADRSSTPIPDIDGFLVGDAVDISDAYVEQKGKKRRR